MQVTLFAFANIEYNYKLCVLHRCDIRRKSFDRKPKIFVAACDFWSIDWVGLSFSFGWIFAVVIIIFIRTVVSHCKELTHAAIIACASGGRFSWLTQIKMINLYIKRNRCIWLFFILKCTFYWHFRFSYYFFFLFTVIVLSPDNRGVQLNGGYIGACLYRVGLMRIEKGLQHSKQQQQKSDHTQIIECIFFSCV